MFSFKNTQKSSATYTPVYGLDKFTVIAINPTKQQIEELTGREYPLEVSYGKTELNGEKFRRLQVWLKGETGAVLPITFNVGNKKSTSKTGKVQHVNSRGSISWSKDETGANFYLPDFVSFAHIGNGEESWLTFLKCLLQVDTRSSEAETFIPTMHEMGLLYEDMFAEFPDFTPVMEMLDGCSIIMPIVAKQYVKDGNIKYAPTLINDSNMMYMNYDDKGVTKYHTGKIRAYVKDRTESGRPLSEKYIVFAESGEFDLERALNKPSPQQENPGWDDFEI